MAFLLSGRVLYLNFPRFRINSLVRSACNDFSSVANMSDTSTSQQSPIARNIKTEIPNQATISIPNPLNHPDYFGLNKEVSLKELFNCRVHYGHKDGSLNEYMLPYIYGSRLGISIIDLRKTAKLLRDALNFTAHLAFRDGIILFVSQNRETTLLIENAAKECGEFAHCRHFRTNTLLNSKLFFNGEIRLPDLIILLNTFNNIFDEHVVVKSAAKLLIPIVGIVDSNSDPRLITYPIPGNDDSPCSIALYLRLFKAAILSGKRRRQEFIASYGVDPAHFFETLQLSKVGD